MVNSIAPTGLNYKDGHYYIVYHAVDAGVSNKDVICNIGSEVTVEHSSNLSGTVCV